MTNTVLLSGVRKRRYLRSLFERSPHVSAEQAEGLADLCEGPIKSIRVARNSLVEPIRRRGAAGPAPAGPALAEPEQAGPEQAGRALAAPLSEPAAEGRAEPAAGPGPAAATPAAPEPPSTARAAPFDPYGFNAILILKRQGRAALLARLAEVAEPAHLIALADAQLIGLDQRLRGTGIAADELRTAIADGVERLLADRKAAAS